MEVSHHMTSYYLSPTRKSSVGTMSVSEGKSSSVPHASMSRALPSISSTDKYKGKSSSVPHASMSRALPSISSTDKYKGKSSSVPQASMSHALPPMPSTNIYKGVSSSVPQHTATSSKLAPTMFLKKRKSEPFEVSLIATSSNKKYKGESSSVAQAHEAFCKICMDVLPMEKMFRNSDCSHVFCRACLRPYIREKVRQKVFPIRCPEINCKGVLKLQSCQKIVSLEVFEKWGKALCESMIPESQRFYCPFKDCSALLVDDTGERVVQSECPNCRRLFCAQCKVSWHPSLSCQEFQRFGANGGRRDDLKLTELAKSKRWKRCPNCKLYVEKTTGCLRIFCWCRFEFCYGCGSPWSDAHYKCHT